MIESDEISSDATDSRTAAAPGRTPTVDIDVEASRLAAEMIDQTWGYRGPVARYGALWDRREVLVRAAALLKAESADEVLRLRKRPMTLQAIADLITTKVRQASEGTVRAYIKIAERRMAAAE